LTYLIMYVKISWSWEQVTCLLTEHEKYPCLYIVKSINHKNKHAPVDALEKSLSELKCHLNKSSNYFYLI
jgi:hypothetical protein